MAQNVLVDLNLNGNQIQNLGAAVAPGDAVVLSQMETAITGGTSGKADAATTVTAGAGLTGGGDLSANRTIDVAAGDGITVTADAVAVDPSWLGLQIDGGIALSNTLLPSDVIAGDGIAVAEGVGDVTLSAVVDPAAGNVLVVGPAGLYVPTPPTAPSATVSSIVAEPGETTVVNNAGAWTVGVDDALTTAISTATATNGTQDAAIAALQGADTALSGRIDALEGVDHVAAVGTAGQIVVDGPTQAVSIDSAYGAAISAEIDGDVAAEATARTSADNALGTRIDTETADRIAGDAALTTRIGAIAITGDGVAVVTKGTGDTWNVSVPAVNVANTYSGTATDAAGITGDLTGQGVTPQGGDIYVSTGNGNTYIYSGTDWVQLTPAAAGVDSLTAADSSVTISAPTGAVTVGVSSALQTAISTATSTNAAQDTAIANLQTADTALSGRVDALETSDTAQGTRLTAIEGVNGTQDTNIAALQAASHAAATGAGAIAVSGGQAVSLTLDTAASAPTGIALTQSATGLVVDGSALQAADAALDTRIDTLETAAGISKSFVASNVDLSSGSAIVTHNLNSTNLMVSVWQNGCLVQAGVCQTDANTITVEGSGTANVVIMAA